MESLSVNLMKEESAGWTSILCGSLNIHRSATLADDDDDCSSLASDASSGSFRLEVSLGCWEKGGSVKHDAFAKDQPYKHNDDCGGCGFEGWNYGAIKGRGASAAGKNSGRKEVVTRGHEEMVINSSEGAASSQSSSTKVRNRDQPTVDFSKTYPDEQHGGTNTNKRRLLKWSWIKQF
ncbi:uncharacterized protein LOC116259641 isoform X2 [Nymphaea colorata]|uniref:uncharacterized protein LOC116259641 isoform X2 n=1 Tax=Nymphaea colorata TaxID=210225 RepID=UPI00129DECB1|nr:uncharacterized protein LOC116259641 isoform X2 [Nymphaea colorata]